MDKIGEFEEFEILLILYVRFLDKVQLKDLQNMMMNRFGVFFRNLKIMKTDIQDRILGFLMDLVQQTYKILFEEVVL